MITTGVAKQLLMQRCLQLMPTVERVRECQVTCSCDWLMELETRERTTKCVFRETFFHTKWQNKQKVAPRHGGSKHIMHCTALSTTFTFFF